MPSKPYLFFSIGLLLLGACSKSEPFEDLELLLDKTWTLTSITREGQEISESCNLDDTLFFEDTKSFSHSRGELLCAGEEDYGKIAKGWEFWNDNTAMRLKFKLENVGVASTILEYWEIVNLTPDTLLLKDALAEENNQIPEFRLYKY